MKYTTEELLEVLRKEYKETGIIPSSEKKRKIHKAVYYHRLGSWNTALEKANIPIRKAQHRRVYTKTCPQCKNEFTTYRKETTYCSTKCSNKSRQIHPPRVNREVWIQTLKERSERDLFDNSFDSLCWDRKRKRVMLEQKEKCNRCGLQTWLDQPLKFEVDHINGNNTDDRRENLEALCPNCHSLTSTWRGRNRGRKQISDEELIEAIRTTDSFRQALLMVGMSPRGANYQRVKKLALGVSGSIPVS